MRELVAVAICSICLWPFSAWKAQRTENSSAQAERKGQSERGPGHAEQSKICQQDFKNSLPGGTNRGKAKITLWDETASRTVRIGVSSEENPRMCQRPIPEEQEVYPNKERSIYVQRFWSLAWRTLRWLQWPFKEK